MVMAGAIFDGSRLMHWFVHSGKLLNHVLAVSGHLLVVQFHRPSAPESPFEPMDFSQTESNLDAR